MIINHADEEFRRKAKEIFLCEDLVSLSVPVDWVLEQEQVFQNGTKAFLSHQQSGGHILQVDLTNCRNSMGLPPSPELWVQSMIPEKLAQEELLLLHDSSEVIGHYMWYRATYVWKEEEKLIRAYYLVHLGDLPQLFRIIGDIDKTGRSLVNSVVGSIRLHPKSPSWRGL
ncbi:hypothetical protein KBI23_02280 [bacterium]|nr:hypothetical protein [bacterium]